jgi:SAM-dependent methyltransferase
MYINKNQIDKYDEIYKQEDYTEFDMPDYKIVSENMSIENKKILVFGAGTARDIIYLLKDNDVYAVDFSKSSVNFLKKLGIKTILADLNKPVKDLKDKSFDLVIAKDILEHLEEPSILLSEIKRVLKPTGYAVLNVPNHFFLPMRLRILFGHNLIWKTIDHSHRELFKEWDYMHKIFFTWKGFQEFINVHGLKIVRNFWDFGTLNHYSQPEMAIVHLENSNKKSLSNIVTVIWKIFNFVLPRWIRSNIVSISPSLFCASFYVWVKPKK